VLSRRRLRSARKSYRSRRLLRTDAGIVACLFDNMPIKIRIEGHKLPFNHCFKVQTALRANGICEIEMLHFNSMEEAIGYCRSITTSGQVMIFRGQECQQKLLPSALRYDINDLLAERRFNEFKIWAKSNLGMPESKNSTDGIIAIAQHYGIPTKFLDFSVSPDVAAHFASQNFNTSGDPFGYIYFGNMEDVSNIPGCRAVTIGVNNLWRLSLQRGLFVEVADNNAAVDLENALGVLRFAKPKIANPPHAVYPERKSSLELMIDAFLFKSDMERGIETFSKAFDADVWKYRVQTYSGVFPLRNNPGFNASWRTISNQNWHQTNNEPHAALRQRKVLTVGIPTDKSGRVLAEFLTNHCATDLSASLSSSLFVTINVQNMDISERLNRLLVHQLEMLWDGMRTLPVANHLIVQSIATSISMAVDWLRLCKNKKIGEDEADYSGEVIASFFFDAHWLRFGPHLGGGVDGAVSKATLLGAINGEAVFNIHPFYKRIIDADRLRIFDYLTEPQQSLHAVRFIEMLYLELIPSAFLLVFTKACEEDAPELDYLPLCSNPMLIAAVTNPGYTFTSFYANEVDLDRVVVFLPGMSKIDIEQEVIGAIHSLFRSGKPLTCKFAWLDEREIWEFVEACEIAKHAMELGLAGVLEVFSEDIRKAIEPEYERGSRGTGAGFGAFELWLMATGRGNLMSNMHSDTFKELFLELTNQILPSSNETSLQCYYRSGGTIPQMHESFRDYAASAGVSDSL
jgi:FRG domain